MDGVLYISSGRLEFTYEKRDEAFSFYDNKLRTGYKKC
jgi:hypothetical protein